MQGGKARSANQAISDQNKIKALEPGKYSDVDGLRLHLGEGGGKWRSVFAEGLNPISERDRHRREAERNLHTFKDVTADAFEARKAELKGDGKAGRWMSPLELHVLPSLGRTPIAEIGQIDIRNVISPIWHTKADTAGKAMAHRDEHRLNGQISPLNLASDWPEPDASIVRPVRPPASETTNEEFRVVFGAWVDRISGPAEAKGAPVDFVVLALLDDARTGNLPKTEIEVGDLLRAYNYVGEHMRKHAPLRFPHTARYGSLQRLTYGLVLFGLFPLIIASGLAMSPGMNAALPWLAEGLGVDKARAPRISWRHLAFRALW